ncbi:acyl-CoA thioesterase [Natronococcus pandeyae]|uniref:Acyl-CoA thioesterase n=1 Tax=Natronococcus pandeyae TaxID=2055836 RepID=A0A8J8Q7Z5_9EURY|nr:thioesterase family protein [Natronococcus pandeyae]TYL40423.1 acyl-CoA thioesterase [Natronococcus pandeyae]
MSDAFTVEVPVRYRDLDPMGHVNNGVYASYLEEARIAYIESVLERGDETFTSVIANLEITYRQSIELGDDPTVSLTVTELGTTSCTMAHEFRVDGGVVATAETTIVHVDPEEQKPTPIPEPIRERIREHEGLEASA